MATVALSTSEAVLVTKKSKFYVSALVPTAVDIVERISEAKFHTG